MRTKKLLALFVFVDFAVFTAVVIWKMGAVGFLEGAVANLASIQVGLDLVIALALVLGWMFRDARRRGVNPWPYALATLFVGSLAPLLYIVLRPAQTEAAPTPVLSA